MGNLQIEGELDREVSNGSECSSCNRYSEPNLWDNMVVPVVDALWRNYWISKGTPLGEIPQIGEIPAILTGKKVVPTRE